MFITVEGIEGVGKSSNVSFIRDWIKNKGIEVITTREPGGTPIAEDLRKILLTEYSESTFPKTELLLLYAARLQHVEHIIKPALNEGKWVICDRFNDATFAYQGAGRGISLSTIETLDKWTLEDFKPDYTIILDASPDVAMARIKKFRQLDRFEKEKKEFFHRIRTAYLMRAKEYPNRYCIVDANEPLLVVQQSLKTILEGFGK